MRIPACPAQTLDETTPEYAARVLRFSLAHGTSTLTADQLARADQGAQWYATTVRNLDGNAQDLEPHQYAILQTYTRARHAIAAEIRIRARLDAQAAQEAAQTTNPPTGGTQPGRPAPLLPAPPSGPGQPDALPLPTAPRRQTAGDGIRF